MILRTIPSTGETIPAVGLGTWQTFDVSPPEAEAQGLGEVLETFVALGGTLIDSSAMYGRAEAVVGALAEKRQLHERLFVATKVWISGKTAGVHQMEQSLRKLAVPRIDLMQVHNLLDVEAHLATLAEWKQAGRVRYVGVTHYTASGHEPLVRVMQRHALDFVQVNYSALERQAEDTVLRVAQDRGIAVLANRPFAEGALFRRLRVRKLPDWAGEIGCASWAELLLKFVISHPAVTCAIPATSDVEHLRANMRAGLEPMPDAKQREAIAAAVTSA
jgi:diketogulonate reductase-like aldo/keto reductase